MANPSATTHVIEIETGIGEPAFIPLALGQELQPISVGKKGMWKLESARVLDVHAFVYFDGTALFLQSADEASAATVDGYKIGKAWTELHAPCSIELGGARLRFRSLQAPNDEAETQLATRLPHGGATQALARPPVQMSPGGGPPPPVPGLGVKTSPLAAPVHRDIPSMPPAAGQPPPGPSAPPPVPLSFPKETRPFKPGEFSSKPDDDESTRIAPLDQHLARSGLSPAAMAHAPPPGFGAPMITGLEEHSTRPEGVQLRPGGSAPQLPPSGMSGQYPQLGMSGQNPMMMGPGGSMPPMPSGQYPGMMPSGQYPGMMPGTSGQYGAMGPGMNPALGGYGGPAPAPEIPKEVGMARLVAEYKSFSGPKKILVFLMPLAMLGGVYILFDDDPPAKPIARRADAGLEAGATTATTSTDSGSPTATTAPTAPGTVPSVAPTEPPPPAVDAGPAPKERDAGTKERDAGKTSGDASRTSAANKTLERQAVDLVAGARYTEAAVVYDQLAAKQQPGSPAEATYREAARICRMKAAPP